jgi:hypothetical protein
MFNPKISISSLKLVSSAPPKLPNIDAIHAESKAWLAPMGAETTPWLENSFAVSKLLATYSDSLRDVGARIGSSTICTAFGALVSDGETSYRVQQVAGQEVRELKPALYKSTRTGTVQVGQLTEPGRMGGLGGWTTDKDAIAGALASYTHNFVAMILAFFSRASLPLTKSVTLPNLVLSETREPKQFVPPLSMSFSKLPSPIFTNTIKVSAPVKSSLWVELWDSGKNTLGKTDILEVEPGTSELVVNHFLMPWENSGYVNIEPNDAPQGLVIESINIMPPV